MRAVFGTLFCAAAVLAPAAVLAAETAEGRADQPLAAVESRKGLLEVRPKVEYERLTITVSGGGRVIERQFKAGEETSFALVDAAGKLLPDGGYSYEIRVVPRVDDETRQALAEARRRDDPKMLEWLRSEGRLPKAPPVQSGHFVLAGGRWLVPEKREPERPTRAKDEGIYRFEGDLEVQGDLSVRGAKNFVVADPDGDGLLYYAALEGPEAGTYYRGSAPLAAGKAVVELPEHFAKLTEASGLTVQLTPVGGWSRLYVVEKSQRRLVVRAEGGDATGFDFLVQGVRAGYADFPVERPGPGERSAKGGAR